MSAKKKEEPDKKVVATHRKARQFYEVLETFEAGLALLGPEVKALRKGQCSLDGCFGREENAQLFLFNFYIPPYQFTTADPPDTRRTRKLLLHSQEIGKIDEAADQGPDACPARGLLPRRLGQGPAGSGARQERPRPARRPEEKGSGPRSREILQRQVSRLAAVFEVCALRAQTARRRRPIVF